MYCEHQIAVAMTSCYNLYYVTSSLSSLLAVGTPYDQMKTARRSGIKHILNQKYIEWVEEKISELNSMEEFENE